MSLIEFLIYILRRIFLPNAIGTMELQMFFLLNRDRRKNHLKSLFFQDDLSHVARKHSRDMAKKDYFEHENKSGHSHVDRYKIERITEVTSGENLAKIGGYPLPVHRAEIGLMNSPGHRANILNESYNCVGIGIHKSEKKVYYFTQNFAYRPLIFLGKIPERIKINKGINLIFKPAEKVYTGIYRIKVGNTIVREKNFKVLEGKNILKIPFSEVGFYLIEIFTNVKGEKHFNLSNSFQLRVGSGWF